MKPILTAFIALSTSTWADLIAHVETDKGTIDVILLYDKAPQAVANFITLAEATRSSVDPDTGAVRNAHYYIGEKFFRIVDDPSFKIAQTGSGTGTNSGGPGYTFRDEFDPSLTHLPYVLSMANSGPNSNGSQIFFTGSTPVHHLDDIHTIFGQIPDAPSRAVIDAILAAGNDGSSITAISFERSDPAAEAFDEFGQNLPSVVNTPVRLSVERNQATTLHFSTLLQAGDLISSYRSTDFASWSQLDGVFSGYDTAPLSSVSIDQAELPSAFYSVARIEHPDSPSPASLANRTLFFKLPGTVNTVTLNFDASGTGGTSRYSASDEDGTIEYVSYEPSGYGASLIVDTSDLIPLRLLMSYDGEVDSKLTGRYNLSTWNGFWNSAGSGTHTLTK